MGVIPIAEELVVKLQRILGRELRAENYVV
jgi:hypothetical protein